MLARLVTVCKYSEGKSPPHSHYTVICGYPCRRQIRLDGTRKDGLGVFESSGEFR